MTEVREIATSFLDRKGQAHGVLRLADRGAATIQTLDSGTAAEHNEERIQLLEGRAYDYQVDALSPHLVVIPSASVQPNKVASNSGRIETGSWTGLLAIEVGDEHGPVAQARFEVRSAKLTYRSEFRAMLNDLAEETSALLLEIKSPASARLSPDPERETGTLHQRVALLRWLLSGREFEQAMEQIAAQPHRTHVNRTSERDPRLGMRPTPAVMREVASAPRRIAVPRTAPLYGRLRELGLDEPTLPVRVSHTSTVENLDTPENRFVKHALSEFHHYLRASAGALRQSQSPSGRRLLHDLEGLERRASQWLGVGLMQSVTRPQSLPLNSPVLQRRAGYREMLRIWLIFQLATRLQWAGADDIVLAGRRDVATLYEYWVFFKLLKLGQGLFNLTTRGSELIEPTADGFDLKLRSGKHLRFNGIYTGGNRVLSVEFNYNQTFTRSGRYPAAGSWTKPMRPDFTFSFWPAEFDRRQAEEQELIVHVHFDAKYRVDDLLGLFGGEDPMEAAADKEDLRRGAAPKRADLLKMHAYRDAIRRTEGAYVLYPGVRSNESQEWSEFHEIIPGLGAFALRPRAEADSLAILQRFLQSIADHVCDATTRAEQLSYHTFRIQEPSGKYRSTLRVGPLDGSRAVRRPPPFELDA